MTRRLLDPSDWSRLADTPQLGSVWRQLRPQVDRVLVVEDSDGAIVATWALVLTYHAEGAWIADAHRGGFAVQRHLRRGLDELAASVGAPAVWTGATDAQIQALCGHLGGQLVPFDSYVIPMTRGES